MTDYPKYQSHKIVGALEIKDVFRKDLMNTFKFGDDFPPLTLKASDPMLSRYQAMMGDFLVIYDAGTEKEYKAFSPRQQFIDGYKPVDAAKPATSTVKVGDIVRIKSGGPSMTVTYLGRKPADSIITARLDSSAEVYGLAWHDEAGQLQTSELPIACVRP